MIELVSIHIPKTAGRSFLAILNSVYDRNYTAHFDRKNYPNKNIPEIEQFKSQLSSSIKVIHGHFQYKEINDLKNIDKMKVITWLRDPIDRVISNYGFFRKRIAQSPNDPELQSRKNETLIEYASMDNSRNRMCKFIEGLDLSGFFFIGITERFNNDIGILAEKLKWGPFQISRINDNSEYKSTLPFVTKEERKIIEKLNMNDVELYSKVRSMSYKGSN